MKRLTALFFPLIFLIFGFSLNVFAEGKTYTETEITDIAAGLLDWKKTADIPDNDWYIIGKNRLAFAFNDDTRQPPETGKFTGRATDRHRAALAMLSGDPEQDVSELMSGGVYNNAALDSQGINGFIWGLIAVDSVRCEIPENALYSREKILSEILKRQLLDGGFAISGEDADPDVTAMALQALAPYYGGNDGVTRAADAALECLSKLQKPDGDFESWGVRNAESTAQVVIALCSLGIDPQTDARFIKNGHTPLDGLMLYRLLGGGFVHETGKANMAQNEQILLALAAVLRQAAGQSALYDFQDLQDLQNKQTVIAATTEPVITAEGFLPDIKYNKYIIIGAAVAVSAVIASVFLSRFHRRGRDWVLVFAVIFAVGAVALGVDIQSVDDYYQEHIDDITPDSETVTVSVRCDVLLSPANWDKLPPALRSDEFVPPDGVILPDTVYVLRAGDTAFTLLKRAAKHERLQLDYQDVTGVYIKGINYLYEFSCGPLSGWTYLINGSAVGVGSDECEPKNGDIIEWVYTCDLGRDVGGIS